MNDSGPPPGELDKLIGTALDPLADATRGTISRVAMRLLVSAQRPLIDHRHQIDRALALELRRSRSEAAELREELAHANQEAANLREWLLTTSNRSDETAGRLGAFVDDSVADREGIVRQLAQIVSRLAGLAERVPEAALLDTTLERFDAGLGGDVIGYRAAGASGEAIDMYVGFEDSFRGSEQEIRERLTVYLPLLDGREPVLDVGCGRGEMLELLRDAEIQTKGIDLDQAMVRRCHAKGLDQVEVGDGVDFLAAADAESLGGVFAAQVIEHLSYESLVSFIRGAHQALGPDGALVMETVNPHCPQALKHFWIDPTHHHPLFPEVVLALCRIAGFATGFIWYPHGSGEPDQDRLREFDYAVVALRSA